MARKPKQEFEFIASRNVYRKRIRDTDGKYFAITSADPEELRRKVAEAERVIAEGKYRAENPTVREYFNQWLDLHAAHVRQTTMTDYRSIVKLYITETMGDYFMIEVTPDLIRQTAVAKASAKSKTIYDKTVMLLKTVFQSAADSDVIDYNPAEKINPRGGKAPKEKVALTDDQTETLLAAVKNTPAYPFCMLGIYAGLRREEILALQWDSVFLDNSTPYLTVQRALHWEHNRPIVSDDLKTRAAKRSVPLHPKLVECLKDLKARKPDSAFVISDSAGGPLSGSQWRNLWHFVEKRSTKERKYKRRLDNGELVEHVVTPVLGQAAKHNPDCICSIDFEVTPHILRHTFISSLVLDGVDVATTQYLAGHENSRTTLDIYTHLKTNRPEDISSKMFEFFKR